MPGKPKYFLSIIESNSTRNSFQSPDFPLYYPTDYMRTHSQCCIFCRFGQMYENTSPCLQGTSSFLKSPCGPSVYPSAFTSPHRLETADLLNVTIVFVFLVFFCTVSYSWTHSDIHSPFSLTYFTQKYAFNAFLHVFSRLIAFFFYRWNNTPCLMK